MEYQIKNRFFMIIKHGIKSGKVRVRDYLDC